jgi:hypothetical protein
MARIERRRASKSRRAMCGAQWAIGLILGSVVACGSGRVDTQLPPPQILAPTGLPTMDAATGPPLGADAVRGTVVDESQRPLAGRVVAIGSARATTDADGRFVLAAAPPSYEAVVADPNGARATVYRGLRRRDPLLVHKPGDWGSRPAHRGTITGRVEGGPFTRTDWASVSFASLRTSGEIFLGGVPGARPGPEFGPFMIAWDGPDAISGDLTATRTHTDPLDPRDAGAHDGAAPRPRRPWEPTVRVTSYLAQQHVTLRDGETLTVDLAPVPLPRLQTRVQLQMPPGVWPTQLYEFYGFRQSHALVHGGGAPLNPRATELEIDMVDARSFGGSLCALAAFGQGQWILTRACDLPLDKPATITLHASPSLQSPAPGSSLRPETTFSWSASDGAVFELELRDTSPTATDPAIDLYTTDTSATWPDLHVLGIGFPTGSASYHVKIAARGPYATLDDALGPEGMGASFPKELWLAESREVELRVEPPLPAGTDEAQCQYVYGTAIVCGDIPNNIEQKKEFYMLAAINNKLRHFPQFANAIGIHCVRDCAGARAFVKAYADYAKAFPGFDANEPLEMDRSGPPPPAPRPPAALQPKRAP